jgi:hypothetical protein
MFSTVVRAVQKMRRLQLHRRTLSSQSTGADSGGDQGPSHQSSIDSYRTFDSSSDPRSGETDASTIDDDPKYRDMLGLHRNVASPPNVGTLCDVDTQGHSMGDRGHGRSTSDIWKLDTALDQVRGAQQEAEANNDTCYEGKGADDDVPIFESPTSDTDASTPVLSRKRR